MRKINYFSFIVFVLLFSFNIVFSQEKAVLLIIAHGSPMSKWNDRVLKLEDEVKTILAKNETKRFESVRVAFMEFAEPSIHSAIKEFERAGIQRVFAVPLFIAPSGHSVFDIPTILGLYGDCEMRERIKKEGTAIVQTEINMTLGPTLSSSNVLKRIMLTRVQELSTKPDSEAVVLLAHGDDDFLTFWDSMCQDIGYYICAHTGIDYFDYVFVEVGQGFSSQGVPVILKAAEKKSKTLVVGLYLSMGTDKMASSPVFNFMGKQTNVKNLFSGKNIVFSPTGLLPDIRVAKWIVDMANSWVNER